MNNRMMTLKKLAELSNFSVSTVSKALTDNPEISKPTKNKIKKLAELYNYIPNITAKNLKEQKTRNIGVIIPNILAHFFAKVLVGIEKEASKQGYHIITCISDESYDKEVKSIEMLANGSVDGLIISISKGTFIKKNYKHIQSIIDRGLPVIQFDRVIDEIITDKIVVDDFKSSYNATTTLIDSGCKNVAFVTPIHNTSVGTRRLQGFQKAINKASNIESSKVFVIDDYKIFAKDFQGYLLSDTIDGVLASDELSAICTMNLIIGLGLKVPEDISVIGFTDGILSENSNPPLTTVNQHGQELGLLAVKQLVNRINQNSEEYKTTIMNTSLIKRKSTCK